MGSTEYLSMDVEERVVGNYRVDFLSNPDLILFPVVVFLISDINKIR